MHARRSHHKCVHIICTNMAQLSLHQEFSYQENGDLVLNWASGNQLHLVFDAKHSSTFFSLAHMRGYNPDLCFVSCDDKGDPLNMSGYVLHVFPNSQHRPIIYHAPVVQSVPRPRWKFQKANWKMFENRLEDSIWFIAAECENYERFIRLVKRLAKMSIPRGYRKEYVPCWSEESDRLYEELKENEDSDTAKELLKFFNETRRAKWSHTMESLDFSISI